jgi:S1-C subfamily serine protease
MTNKIIIGILVLLVFFMGGFGYYAYDLTQQIDHLDKQLAAFETAQTARIDAVSNELTSLRTETTSCISTIESNVADALSRIDALQKEADTTQSQLANLETEMGNVTAQVDALQEQITEVSRSAMDASKLYEKAVPATVMITAIQGQTTALGSGVIFDTEGRVLTAYHVVEGLSLIYVTLHDGRVYQATNLGASSYSDIAVLKLEADPSVVPPPLADSSLVKIGEPAAVIGSPAEPSSNAILKYTLTAGVISQTDQFIDYGIGSGIANLLQFDAAVNPGNSGGPLFNAAGEIIGIVVARIDTSQGGGISWAVSSNKARRVAAAIIDHGYFDYPWVGIGIANLTPPIAQEMGLGTTNGVLVVGIYSGTPAQAAGIQDYDIIVAIDDIPIQDIAGLTSYLGEFKSPGDNITIKLIRGTTELEIPLTIGKR